MPLPKSFAFNLLLCLVTALIGFALDVNDAYAQSASCAQLNQQLRNFDRNSDFKNAEGNNAKARKLAADLQDAESAYVRTGCNDAAKAGQPLTKECRNLARIILRGRTDLAGLNDKVQTAGAIAQQREALLQEISRFGCNGGSNVTVTNQQNGRDGLFNQLFGGFTTENDPGAFGDGEVTGGQFQGLGGYSTVRTVCVRLSDGYYWPVSYSTLPDFVSKDVATCQAQCPGSEVDLYYYRNPGQDPEDMVNLYGQAYRTLPNAFRYRREYDQTATCKVTAPNTNGLVTIAGGDGDGRAVAQLDGVIVPLPLRDPRHIEPVIDAPLVASIEPQVQYVDVPLPRRRPGSAVPPTVQPLPSAGDRVVMFGDKKVRIVGPNTPYVQALEAGI